MADEIVLDGVSKRFAAAGAPTIDRVTLRVARGEILVVVGPSGCGKSTTLRLVAGLEEPELGTVSIAGRSMKGVPPQDRDVAMVFQGYALYPQMTVREILAFPLRMRGASKDDRARAVAEASSVLRLDKLLDRRPDELSGGERQRVAMGRALVRKPRVFLFDEPLSNLDASLRGDLRLEIGRIVRRLGATAVYVTHDHVEAMTLGDRIAVMRDGRIDQVGTPREVYEQPASAFVGGFLGTPRMNLVPARIEGGSIAAGAFRVPSPALAVAAGDEDVTLGIRPEDVLVDEVFPAGEGSEATTGEVIAVEPLGAETHLVVRVGETELRARCPGFRAPARGSRVRVALRGDRAHVFGRDGLRRG
ncbi:MAG TPA: ABC transporter ATP-binding protein [Polyangiaceae bacterium]|jgi:multiple sugar transport system ATP-binding protein|nr:ABC transporter ATP-binding protein [Polyangiaceae bacterium]